MTKDVLFNKTEDKIERYRIVLEIDSIYGVEQFKDIVKQNLGEIREKFPGDVVYVSFEIMEDAE